MSPVVNVVRVADDADFQQLRNICDCNEEGGWIRVYEKRATRVWTKKPPGDGQSNSDFHMIKVRGELSDVSATVAYDVLHDAKYRPQWDKYMIATWDIGIINPNNDICYYALGAMPPFRNRDFVLQRSWLDIGGEKFILSHSVCHTSCPPTKNCVRGTVFLTGYMVRALDTGCQVTYVTHSDPKGKLPTWLVNRMTKIVAPKLIRKLHRACVAYPQWKAKNEPDRKPWTFPEQQANVPRIRLEDCVVRDYDDQTTMIDESAVSETRVQDDDDEKSNGRG